MPDDQFGLTRSRGEPLDLRLSAAPQFEPKRAAEAGAPGRCEILPRVELGRAAVVRVDAGPAERPRVSARSVAARRRVVYASVYPAAIAASRTSKSCPPYGSGREPGPSGTRRFRWPRDPARSSSRPEQITVHERWIPARMHANLSTGTSCLAGLDPSPAGNKALEFSDRGSATKFELTTKQRPDLRVHLTPLERVGRVDDPWYPLSPGVDAYDEPHRSSMKRILSRG